MGGTPYPEWLFSLQTRGTMAWGTTVPTWAHDERSAVVKRAEVPCHAGEGRGLSPAGPARGREPPRHPRPRGQHEYATRYAPDHRGADGRRGDGDLPLQLSLHGAWEGT